MRGESLGGTDLFKFDSFSCLRSDYAKNECSICIDLCPEEAMVFDRNRLTLDRERCTGCAACVGSCPTEALISEVFDPNIFAVEFPKRSGGGLISCKESLPCLGALSVEHLITIALRSESEPVCDLAHCKECTVNSNGNVLKSIERSVEEARSFLKSVGIGKGISVRYDLSGDADAGRRGLLKKLTGIAAEFSQDVHRSEQAASSEERVPLKRVILKNSLKAVAEDFGDSSAVESLFSFAANKKIDADSCTNCQECAMFCPDRSTLDTPG
ncbi:ferredoxin [Hydrogenimonas sp.]|nr:ferredoxin [Hydrogenimonas sp.]